MKTKTKNTGLSFRVEFTEGRTWQYAVLSKDGKRLDNVGILAALAIPGEIKYSWIGDPEQWPEWACGTLNLAFKGQKLSGSPMDRAIQGGEIITDRIKQIRALLAENPPTVVLRPLDV